MTKVVVRPVWQRRYDDDLRCAVSRIVGHRAYADGEPVGPVRAHRRAAVLDARAATATAAKERT